MRPAIETSYRPLFRLACLASFSLALLSAQSHAQGPPSGSATRSKAGVPSLKAVPASAELIAALEKPDAALALRLVKLGADPNATTDNFDDTALGMAARLGDIKIVQALLDRGATVNPTDSRASKPLCLAIDGGNSEVMRLLIEKGADVNATGAASFQEKPLTLAAAQNLLPIVTLLIQKGATVNGSEGDGVTALDAAASVGSVPILELLVAHGADVKNDPALLNAAVLSGNVAAVDYLTGQGRALTEPLTDTTFLHSAAASNVPAMIERVLAAGAVLDAVDSHGETALMVGTSNQLSKSVSLLLAKKARVDIVSSDYETAYDLAAKPISRLLAGDADAEARHKEILAALTKAGAAGAQPSLWRAAYREELPLLKEMLAHGADPNVADSRGNVPLVYALSSGFSSTGPELVAALLEKGADPNARSSDGRTLVDIATDNDADESLSLLRRAGAIAPQLDLNEAITRNDAALIDKLLTDGVVPTADSLAIAMGSNDNSVSGRTEARVNSDRDLIARLIAKGAPVNGSVGKLGGASGGFGAYPLTMAAFLRNVDAVRLLLEHGADANIHKKDEPSPLLSIMSEPKSTSRQDEDIDTIVHLLVEHGADVRASTTDGNRETVLGHIASVASVKTLEFVAAQGAMPDVNVPHSADDEQNEARSPLSMAATSGRVENVRFLLDHGADPNRLEEHGHATVLMSLLQLSDIPVATKDQIAALLIAKGIRLDIKTDYGENALRLAIDRHDIEIANRIRKAGSRTATADPGLQMAWAINRGDLESVKTLLSAGYAPNTPVLGGESPLYEAAIGAHLDIVQLLLKHGADPNAANQYGSAMRAAAFSGDIDIVSLLLAKGAKPDDDNGFSGTPLSAAAEEGHVDVMQLLLKKGADPNARKSKEPGSPLDNALKSGSADAVDILLKAGADPNIGYAMRRPLLFGDVEVLQKLVRAGGNVNNQDSTGRTLLMEASSVGSAELVAWLIAHRANVNLQDKEGHSALKDALAHNKLQCAQLLRKAGAQ